MLETRARFDLISANSEFIGLQVARFLLSLIAPVPPHAAIPVLLLLVHHCKVAHLMEDYPKKVGHHDLHHDLYHHEPLSQVVVPRWREDTWVTACLLLAGCVQRFG